MPEEQLSLIGADIDNGLPVEVTVYHSRVALEVVLRKRGGVAVAGVYAGRVGGYMIGLGDVNPFWPKTRIYLGSGHRRRTSGGSRRSAQSPASCDTAASSRAVCLHSEPKDGYLRRCPASILTVKAAVARRRGARCFDVVGCVVG
jgi:hypothetical protein